MHALRPRIEEDDLDFARETLSESEALLFFAMERRDQRHALAVARMIHRGTEDRPLLSAALLHDCGKGRVPLWLRIFNVLSPGGTGRLAADGRGWRAAAYRLRHHAEIGADMAREAGSSAMTVRLIRGHVEPDEAWCYELLLAADDAS
jgi:hypothetical protein